MPTGEPQVRTTPLLLTWGRKSPGSQLGVHAGLPDPKDLDGTRVEGQGVRDITEGVTPSAHPRLGLRTKAGRSGRPLQVS